MIVRNHVHYYAARARHTSTTVKVLKAFTYGADSYKPGARFPLSKLRHDDELRGLWASELIALDSERAA